MRLSSLRPTLAALFCLIAIRQMEASAPPPGCPVELSESEITAINQALDAQWKTISPKPRGDVVFRQFFTMFLNALATGWHPERMRYILERAAELQDTDPESKSYGNFRWEWRHKVWNDRNAVEFAMHRAALALILYNKKMPPEVRTLLDEMTTRAIEGIKRHRVAVSYTNVFVIKTWNLIALGEALNRPELAEQGYKMLDEWLAYTWENGVREYNSPSYMLGYITPLAHIARFAQRPEGRANAAAGVRYGWIEATANWFGPGERLGGAHARDYRFLTGAGVVTRLIRSTGWLPPQPPGHDPGSDSGGIYWKAAHGEDGKGPVAIAPYPVPRFIYQMWGKKNGEYATHYVGKNFSLGAAGACYGTTDKPLSMTWAGDSKLPMMNFLVDGRGDPYGISTFLTGGEGGHYKALHLVPFLMSVQRDSEVLLLASIANNGNIGPRHGERELKELSSHLTLPVMEQWWLDDRPLPALEHGAAIDVPAGASLYGKRGDVIIGIRILSADLDGKPSPVKLIADGLKYNACRVTAEHSPTRTSGRATISLWVRAEEGLDPAGMDAFRQTFSASKGLTMRTDPLIDVVANGRQGVLRLRANLQKDERLIVQGGDATIPRDSLIWINGRDVGRELLEGAPALHRAPRLRHY